jgi:iron-sulfur cluster biosynthesis transcriptional regulator SufR
VSGPRDRILHLLKRKGPQSAAELARRLKVTPMAVRQHLKALAADGLVAYRETPSGVGRPARVWRLTGRSRERFPDSHGELVVDLLAAMRQAFGDQGLERLVAARTKAQKAAYRARIPGARAALAKKVAALTAIRKDEGYMAEWSKQRDGTFLLVENHCPICAAAEACQGLCLGELELFRSVLGRGVKVERTEHLLTGARRCVYRIG